MVMCRQAGSCGLTKGVLPSPEVAESHPILQSMSSRH